MLSTILTITIITLIIITPVITLALCKVAKEADKEFEHLERIVFKGDKYDRKRGIQKNRR